MGSIDQDAHQPGLTWLREVIAVVIIGAGIFAIGAAVPWRGWYLVGLIIGALGLGALAVIIFGRLLRRRWPRWLIAAGLVLVLIAVGAIVPQLAIGRPSSRPLWQITSGGAPAARLISGRLYLHSAYTDQLLDPATGRILASVPAVGSGMAVGTDGSFVQRGKRIAVYRGPDGRQRWKITTNGSVTVLAIADGWVVMRGCTGGQDVICGVDASGHIAWREEKTDKISWLGTIGWERQYSSNDEAEPFGQASVELAARVVVRVNDLRRGELFSPSHRRIGPLPGVPLAVGGELVVTVQDAGGGTCRFVGLRGLDQVFRSPNFTCADVTLTGSYLMLNRRMYFLSHKDSAGDWQLDLRSGGLRRTSTVAVDSDPSGPRTDVAFPSDAVIARQTGRTITGLDPATGQTLWTYTAGGDGVPGVTVGNGAVIVLSRLPDREATLAGLDPRDSPKLDTVLDARTGKVTGRWVLTGGLGDADGIWDDYGLGAGRALIMINRGDAYAIGR